MLPSLAIQAHAARPLHPTRLRRASGAVLSCLPSPNAPGLIESVTAETPRADNGSAAVFGASSWKWPVCG